MAENEYDETTEETDQERNWRALEAKSKAQEAELAELRPLKEKEAIREAGFDPDSDRGKAISNAIKVRRIDGDVDLSTEGIRELAQAEYGYSPGQRLNADEQERQDSQSRMDSLRTSSESDREVTLADQIAEAEAAGDWATTSRLKLQQVQEIAQAKGF